jgi:hypothetical protein
MNDDVHASRHGWYDEVGTDVVACEQWQGAQLGDGFARTVGMQCRHRRHATVHRHKKIECLSLAHLAHDQTRGTHPQCLAHEPSQRDLARAFQPGIACLHRNPIGCVKMDLKYVLTAYDALPSRDRSQERIEKSCLARLCATGDHHIESGHHGRVEESRRLLGEDTERDEVVQGARTHDKAADVDRPVLTGDVGNHDMQSTTVSEHRVDKRMREINSATRRTQKTFDEIAHFGNRQHHGGQFTHTVARNKDASRGVDPQLLDRGVIQQRVQRCGAGRGFHTGDGTSR